ncbi:hypothetical protein BC826DRAFT_976502 [Russula brevipes]|nr:hypothetical protein BC826DRAFT_976502 [Russula brevipes]
MWGVYDNVRHHATPTSPRTRKRVGGTYDDTRPPRRRHPLALANAWGYMTTTATARLRRPLALVNVWGGTYDDARPPHRQHPLALANTWGVYDNVRHHTTPTPRTRKRVGGNIQRCPAATPPTPRARKRVWGIYDDAGRHAPATPAPHARKCMGGVIK